MTEPNPGEIYNEGYLAGYNAHTQEVVEIINDVDLSYAVNDGRPQDELRGGQFACCEIRRLIKNTTI